MEPAFIGKVILPILFPVDVDADCMSRTPQNANTTRGLELPSAFDYYVALKQYPAPAVVEILARLKGDADRLENRRVTTSGTWRAHGVSV
jgi:hypothetical protein